MNYIKCIYLFVNHIRHLRLLGHHALWFLIYTQSYYCKIVNCTLSVRNNKNKEKKENFSRYTSLNVQSVILNNFILQDDYLI